MATIGVVVAGLAVIMGIVVASPRWQRIVASWREGSQARTALMPPASGGAPAASIQLRTIGPAGVEVQQATAGSPATGPRRAPEPASARPSPVSPPVPTQPGGNASIGAQSDSTRVMASLLVAQLGQEPAWKTALANADAHAADSPEHAYWRGVAAAIRDGGGHRSRP